MIYPANISFPPSPSSAPLGTKPKSHEPAAPALGSPDPIARADASERDSVAHGEGLHNHPAFPAGVPPLADERQAAAATHHVSLLLRAQPGLALAAQANASSQSVQRLLQ